MSELDLLVGGLTYVVLLLVIGGLGRRARGADGLGDHFLASRSLGFFVLLVTLFATQYSGNSFAAFPGRTYRGGLAYFMSVSFMVAVVTGYALFAPRLVALARKRRFITPVDFLAERFRSPAITAIATVIFVVALGNYLLAQLIVMGQAMTSVTGGAVPYWAGVVGGAVIVLIYESLGGMRAVAWTDAVQGVAMALGLLAIVALTWVVVGSPAAVIQQIGEIAPEKVANPSFKTCLTWLSTFLLLGLGAPLYPQAIQRLYSAKKVADLRRALAVMAFLPLFAVTAVVYIGLAGLATFPGLTGTESDQVTFLMLSHLTESHPLARLPALAVLVAVMAAIMSTADSALLSLSSTLTKDCWARVRNLSAEATDRLAGLSRWTSLAVLAVLVPIAVEPRQLWGLLVIKFEILIQLSPAFVLGTLHREDDAGAYRSKDILHGLLVGLAVGIGLFFAGHRKVGGIHAGVIGLSVNYLVVVISHVLYRRSLRTETASSDS